MACRHEITTMTEIDAPPPSVWKVLVDFQAHPQWNPFVRRIEGSPHEGAVTVLYLISGLSVSNDSSDCAYLSYRQWS
jgi:hypothetical protein